MYSDESIIISGLGGWTGMLLGILYIYNKEANVSMGDMAIVVSAPVATVATIRLVFTTLVSILSFSTNVYATMLDRQVQLVALFMILSSAMVAGIGVTIQRWEKLRDEQVHANENMGNEEVVEDDADQTYDETTEGAVEEVAEEGAAEEEVAEEEVAEEEVAEEEVAEEEVAEEEVAEEEDEDATDDASDHQGGDADDESDVKYEAKMEDLKKRYDFTISDMYKRIYGIMFIQ